MLCSSSAVTGGKDAILDPRIERMLWHLEDDTKRSVVDEIVFEMDLDEILEARDAIFEEVVTTIGIQNGDPADSRGKDAHFPRNTRQIAIPWKVIKRRIPTLAADDLCDIYLYKLNPKIGFPFKMLKRKTLAMLAEPPALEGYSLGMIPENEPIIDTTPPIAEEGDPGIMSESHSSTYTDNVVKDETNDFEEKQQNDKPVQLPSNNTTVVIEKPDRGQAVDDISEGFWGTYDRFDMQNTCPVPSVPDKHETTIQCQSPANESAASLSVGSPTHAHPVTTTLSIVPSTSSDSSSDGNPRIPVIAPIHNAAVLDPICLEDNTRTVANAPLLDPVIPNPSEADRQAADPTPFSTPRNRSTSVECPPSAGTCLPVVKLGNSVSSDQSGKDSAQPAVEPAASHIVPVFSRPVSGVDKSTSTVVDMATQTGPNVIFDPPVKKSEFSGQMDYIDSSLTDHERRMRACEMRNERGDQKVNKLDADIYSMYSDLRISHDSLINDHDDLRRSHEALADDHNSLKRIVSDILKVSPIYEKLILEDESTPFADPIGAPIQRSSYKPMEPIVLPMMVKSSEKIQPTEIGSMRTQPLSLAPPYVPNLSVPKPGSGKGGVEIGYLGRKPLDSGTTCASDNDPKPVVDGGDVKLAKGASSNHPSQTIPGNGAGAIPKKTTNYITPADSVYVFPANPVKDKGGVEKKRYESPADSFLKETKRVIPQGPGKRAKNNGPKNANNGPKRMTSTPSNPRPTTHPIALSNMFTALDTLDPNPSGPQGNCHVKTNSHKVSVDLSSPEEFPTLPRKTNAKLAPKYNQYVDEHTGQQLQSEQSWAEIDDDDNRTIEAFLSTVKGSDIPPKNVLPIDNQVVITNNTTRDHSDRAKLREDIVPAKEPGMGSAKYEPRNTDHIIQTHKVNVQGDPPRPKQPQGQRDTSRQGFQYSEQGAVGGTQNNFPATVRPKTGQSNNAQTRNHPERTVSRNGWHTNNKKRKRTKSSTLTFPTISGGQTKPYRDVFVGNLRTELYNDPEEMSDALQDYIEARGVDVFFIKTMNSQYEGFANAKIVVATGDYDTVISRDFWPENIFVREWYQGKEKDKKQASAGNHA